MTNIFVWSTIGIVKEARDNSQFQQGNTVLVVLIIVLLIIAGAVVYFLTQSSKQQQETVEEQIGTQPQTQTETTQLTEVEGEPLPEKDSVGTEDLSFIGRYPGSVRVGYTKDNEMERTAVDYVAKASIEEVKEYYVEELEGQEWEIETVDEDQIRFGKGEETLFVNFYYDEGDKILKYYFEYYPTSNY